MIIPDILQASDRPLLSARTAFDSDFAAVPSATVSWKFNVDGTLEKDEGGTATIFGSEWWSAGVTAAKGNAYDVRCKAILSGPVFTAEGAAVGTYIQMNLQRVWTLTAAFPRNIVATFQLVATGTTIVLAEADLTFTANAETNA